MSQTRIMIVEDEGILALDIQKRLLGMGYAVPVVTASGEEAFRKAGDIPLDLVLIDTRLMGAVDGIGAVLGGRASEDIPVVYIAAPGNLVAVDDAQQAAPYGYILTPFDDLHLRNTIEMALYRHNLEKKLRESQQWLSTTLNSIGDAVVAADPQGRVLFMNASAAALTGWAQNDAIGKDIGLVLRLVDETTRLLVQFPVAAALLDRPERVLPAHSLLIAQDGKEIPVEDSLAPIKDGRGSMVGFVLVFRDITARRKKDEALRRSEFTFRNMIAQLPVGIALFNADGCVVEANPVVWELLGVSSFAALEGLCLFDDRNLSQDLKSRIRAGEGVNFQACVDYDAIKSSKLFQKKKSGKITLEFTITPWLGEGNTRDGYLLQVQDISLRKQAEERILHDARHDSLTGLPNRTYFLEQLLRAHALSRRRKEYIAAVLFMDLDRFKAVNDSLGHDAGDQVLVVIAQRLKNCLRPGDFVARFGGDEFAILLENINAVSDAISVAERVLTEVSKTISLMGRELSISTSIGIALTTAGQAHAEDLLRSADSALYRAKNSGRSRYAVYEE